MNITSELVNPKRSIYANSEVVDPIPSFQWMMMVGKRIVQA